METIGIFVIGAMGGAVLFCVAVILTALAYERKKDEKNLEVALAILEDERERREQSTWSVSEQYTERKRGKKGKGINRVQ